MSALRLTGATSGWAQLEPSAIAGDQTFILPGTGGTLDRLNRAGNILQVVHASSETATSTTSTTLVASNVTASITLSSASNKVLILCEFNAQNSATTGGAGVNAALRRGTSTDLWPLTDQLALYMASSINLQVRNCLNYLDTSPGTTTPSYTLYFARVTAGTAYIQTGSMTLLEIAP